MDSSKKRLELQNVIRGYAPLLIAFSGGVDSSLLLAVAKSILKDRVLAVTAVSPIHPEKEIEKARRFAQNLGVRHIVIPSHEMDLPDFIKNDPERCYYCKKSLVLDLKRIAADEGFAHIAHGANLDDLKDHRPGFRAAEELGVVSPLMEAGFTKNDIRELARNMGLDMWNAPAQPCLATRLPYGTPIDLALIQKVGKAEDVLLNLGFPVCRVRHHGDMARIEVPEADFSRILDDETRRIILGKLREIGYLYIALDLGGYVQGNMNQGLIKP